MYLCRFVSRLHAVIGELIRFCCAFYIQTISAVSDGNKTARHQPSWRFNNKTVYCALFQHATDDIVSNIASPGVELHNVLSLYY